MQVSYDRKSSDGLRHCLKCGAVMFDIKCEPPYSLAGCPNEKEHNNIVGEM